MTYQAPPIVQLAERVFVAIEDEVRRFARYNRYQLGAELRAEARTIVRLANRAWRDRARQAAWVEQLVWAVDDLKQSLQLGKRQKAFSSFAQFEHLARMIAALGKQCGGWHRQQQHRKSQSPAAQRGGPERAQTLSTRSASAGAYA